MNGEIRRLGLDASHAAAGHEDLVQNALCPICHDYIEDAKEADCEGRHVFCGPCIKDVSDRKQPCPCCRGAFSKMERPQGLVRSFIEQVKWKCVNYENGCAFTGTKKQLENHLDDGCAVQQVKCRFSGCPKKMQKRSLESHKKTCPYRTVACEHCDEQVRLNAKAVHQKDCLKFPVPCPNKCGQKVPRGEVCHHLGGECAETVVHCRVSGCGERMKRKMLDQHEEDNTKKHLKLLHTEVDRIKSLHAAFENLKTKFHFAQMHSSSSTFDGLTVPYDTFEVAVRFPDFETNAAGKVKGDVLQSVPFLFQDHQFCLRVLPKGDSSSGEGSAAVYLTAGPTYNGVIKFRLDLSNGNVQKNGRYDFSINSSIGWKEYCTSETLLAAARATPGGALEIRVRLSAPKSNRASQVVSGYAIS